MQKIKQELQKAIAQLKGEWGINNFSLQDLAAILEKVVAAVDKAAQLPVVPDSVGGGVKIVEGYTLTYRAAPEIFDYNAPTTAKPAIGISNGNIIRVFFDADSKRSYSRNNEGEFALEFFRDKILCDGNTLNYIAYLDGEEKVLRASGTFIGEDSSFFV